jgi:hypothetical protein
MAIPIEEGLKDLLVAASVGAFEATTGWGIYIGKHPKTPDSVIVIASSGGFAPDPKWLLDFPTFQIRIRGNKGGYQEATLKAKDVKDTLLGLPSQDVNGDRWVSVRMLSDNTLLGYDENDRPMFSMNFTLITEPATSGLTNRQAL